MKHQLTFVICDSNFVVHAGAGHPTYRTHRVYIDLPFKIGEFESITQVIVEPADADIDAARSA